MPVREPRGNMYPKGLIDGIWNIIAGCEHDCIYCYLKYMAFSPSFDFTFRDKYLNDDLEKWNGKRLFAGSSGDIWTAPEEYVDRMLEKMRQYPEVEFFFQSKAPENYIHYIDRFPKKSILATTLETDLETGTFLYHKWGISKAPSIFDRWEAMCSFRTMEGLLTFPRIITVEPVLKFEPENMLHMLKLCDPYLVIVGANTSPCDLEEPTADDLEKLFAGLDALGINHLKKANLTRIYDG